LKAKAIVCLVVAGVFLFLALMLACCAPVTLRLAAPVACPDGYARSAVVAEVSNPEPGTTSVSSELYCVDRSGVPIHANWIVAVVALAAEAMLLATLAGLIVGLRIRLTRRASP